MADIFISYASEDRSKAETIAKVLEEYGWSVWWDRTIPPGKTFDQVIEEAINAARCVVVLWSKKSIKSDWVKEEANIGKERKILVPAKIDPVDLPLGFGRIQAADLTNWEGENEHPGFLSLRNAISEVAGPSPERAESVEVTQLPESNLQEAKTKDSEAFQADTSHLKPLEKEPPITGPKAPPKKRLAFGIGALALILVLSVIGWFFFSKYTITVSSGPNGKILPEGPVSVSHGESQSFEIRPSPGYDIEDVKVDGEPVGAVPSYVFNDVTGDHKISASFAKVESFTISIVVVLNPGQEQVASELSAALSSAGFTSSTESRNGFLRGNEALIKTIGTRVFPTPAILLGGNIPENKIEELKDILYPFLETKDISIRTQLRSTDGSMQVLGKRVVAIFL